MTIALTHLAILLALASPVSAKTVRFGSTPKNLLAFNNKNALHDASEPVNGAERRAHHRRRNT